MTDVSRRGFMVQATVGSAAAATGVAALELVKEGRPTGINPDTLLLHVRDIATSEISANLLRSRCT